MTFCRFMGYCWLALGFSLTSAHTMASAAPLDVFAASSGDTGAHERVVNGSLNEYYKITGDVVATAMTTNPPVFTWDHDGSSGAASAAVLEGHRQSGYRSGQYAGTVSAVPLPAAAVLFGSALLGFVGFATRRRLS